MRKYSNAVMRYFKCPDCDCIVPVSKNANTSTTIGHVKTIYCPFCKEDRDFTMFDSEEIKRTS